MGGPRRKPTIRDVARRAGVSTAAVSFGLNGRPGVGAETRERILAAAADLGWTPTASARALRRARADAVGLVIAREPGLLAADPFFPAFIAGVETELAPLEQALLLQVIGTDLSNETRRYEQLTASERVDGVFLTDLRIDDPRPDLCARLGLPAVTLGRPATESPHPAVCLDDKAGIRAAVEHLRSLGHERIAHVSGRTDLIHGASRAEAFSAAANGPVVAADFTAASGAAATARLLRRQRPPTAIVYANDVMAIAGLTVATELGIKVPDELSIVGFDDTELAAHVQPPLTSVRSDAAGWGRAAARALLNHIDGRGVDVDLPPARLVVRASTSGRRAP
jgi:LacI family transcriptional regulator, repressor for deo operon, udp, cdd, tsx, nupC, and nupG